MLVSQSPTIILVIWTQPQSPNGDILQYLIERRVSGTVTGAVIRTFLPDEPKQYRDDSDEIQPDTTYEYRIVAETAAGKGYGPWAEITTRAASELI